MKVLYSSSYDAEMGPRPFIELCVLLFFHLRSYADHDFTLFYSSGDIKIRPARFSRRTFADGTHKSVSLLGLRG